MAARHSQIIMLPRYTYILLVSHRPIPTTFLELCHLLIPAVVCCSFFRATASISPDISCFLPHPCRWHRFFDQKIPKVWKWRPSSVLSSKTKHLSSKVFLSLQVDFYDITVWSCCTSIGLKHAHCGLRIGSLFSQGNYVSAAFTLPCSGTATQNWTLWPQ